MKKPKPAILNLDLDLLRAFQAVAETKSFTRAGGRMGRSQSAISLKVRKLETGIGCALFERDKQRVVLTLEGEALLRRSIQLLRMNDEIVSELNHQAWAGDVRLGAPEDFATAHLPGILGAYSVAYPGVTLTVTCDLTLNLIENIARGQLDLALIKREPMGNFDGVPVWREPLIWVASAKSLHLRGVSVPLIVAPSPCVYRKRMITALDAAGLPWRISYTSPSLAGQLAALRAGLGISALPRKLAPADLKHINSLPQLAETEIALVRSGRVLPPAAVKLERFILASLDRDAELPE